MQGSPKVVTERTGSRVLWLLTLHLKYLTTTRNQRLLPPPRELKSAPASSDPTTEQLRPPQPKRQKHLLARRLCTLKRNGPRSSRRTPLEWNVPRSWVSTLMLSGEGGLCAYHRPHDILCLASRLHFLANRQCPKWICVARY
jgi:hypothetical protein